MSNPYLREQFFKRRVTRYTPYQIDIAKAIYQLWKPSSVYDLGCGIGGYLEGFYRCGCTDIAGSEYGWDIANKYMTEAVRAKTCRRDASDNLDPQRKYDLSMSIDVAEHLNSIGSMAFCNNLVKLSSNRILLTAAVVGQPGTGHINCQPLRYWIDRIECCGGKYDIDETLKLMNALIPIDKIGAFKHAMVFNVEEMK